VIINTITGTVVRALPTADGLEIKVAAADRSHTLSVPGSQRDLVHALRSARMSGESITIRYNAGDVVIGTAAPALARAA